MLRVAQIIYSGLGGHGSVAFSLIEADQNGEWRPTMGFFGIEPLNPHYRRRCESRDIPYKDFVATPGRSWLAWLNIFRWLKHSRPEAIILHSLTALLPCFAYARLEGRTPLVVVEHQPNALKSRSEWVFSRLAMILADRVVVLTPAYDAELRHRLGLFYRARKVEIIPNGIATWRYAPLPDGEVADKSVVRLGMAARFTNTKRQDALIDALGELRRREPGIDWRLSLAGGGECLDSVERKAQAVGLDAWVEFPGLLNEDRLIDWYRSLDVYLHASEGEALSTSLLQAMASALPIVASDVPGITDLITGKAACGLLVRGQSPDGFANAIMRIINDPALRKEMGGSSRRLVLEGYSDHQMFAKFASLLVKDVGGSLEKQSIAQAGA